MTVKNEQVRVGAFNQRLIVQEEQTIADGCGGFEHIWNTVHMVWAVILPISATDQDRAKNRNQFNTHRKFVRTGSPLKQGTRLVMNNRVFEISSVIDPDETGRYQECITRESVLP